VTKHRYRCFIS